MRSTHCFDKIQAVHARECLEIHEVNTSPPYTGVQAGCLCLPNNKQARLRDV